MRDRLLLTLLGGTLACKFLSKFRGPFYPHNSRSNISGHSKIGSDQQLKLPSQTSDTNIGHEYRLTFEPKWILREHRSVMLSGRMRRKSTRAYRKHSLWINLSFGCPHVWVKCKRWYRPRNKCKCCRPNRCEFLSTPIGSDWCWLAVQCGDTTQAGFQIDDLYIFFWLVGTEIENHMSDFQWKMVW